MDLEYTVENYNRKNNNELPRIIGEKIILAPIPTCDEFYKLYHKWLSNRDIKLKIGEEYVEYTEQEVKEECFVWRDSKIKEFNFTKSAFELVDDVKNIDDGITKEIIRCSHERKCNHECAGVFRITNQELQFYRKLNIPLPQICQNCRHYARFAWRNPPRFWHRKCMKPGCLNEFETSYAPDRKEIIYCEACYNAEVA